MNRQNIILVASAGGASDGAGHAGRASRVGQLPGQATLAGQADAAARLPRLTPCRRTASMYGIDRRRASGMQQSFAPIVIGARRRPW